MHRGNSCSYGIGVTVALSSVQQSDRLLFYRCQSGTVCSAVQGQIAVLPVLQWHCPLCSTAIDCCSTGATVALSAVQQRDRLLSAGVTVALSAVQYSDTLIFYRCYSGTACCAVQRLIAVLPVLEWPCLLCSTAIDCFSTCATVALSTQQYSDKLLFYRC